MQSLSHASADYNRVEKAIKFLENHFSSQPGLKDIAAHIGLSEYHFQRLFSRWVGISPKRFLQFLNGTNFQIKVWEALIKIPFGAMVSYEDVAVQIGLPKAIRAVGTAVGKNPISFIIPCHRVIRKNAEFGSYGGGPARKKAILGWEAAHVGFHA